MSFLIKTWEHKHKEFLQKVLTFIYLILIYYLKFIFFTCLHKNFTSYVFIIYLTLFFLFCHQKYIRVDVKLNVRNFTVEVLWNQVK